MNRQRIAELRRQADLQGGGQMSVQGTEMEELLSALEEMQGRKEMSPDWQQRVIKWTREGFPTNSDEFGDTELWTDQVWWGYWRQVGGEEVRPPDALFRTAEEVLSLANLIGDSHEWHIQPVVLAIEARDNYDIPK